MKAFGIIWVHLCVALLGIVCLTGLASAQCSEQGWALGTYEAATNTVHYAAEGPARTWVNKGWTDSNGTHYQIDERLADAGFLFLVVTSPNGEPPQRLVMARYKGMCGYVSEPAPTTGDRVVFGNVIELQDHAHPEVKPYLHGMLPNNQRS